MKNTIVKHNQVQGECSQTGIFLETEGSKNSFLKKVDAFSTWMLDKLLPKNMISSPPPDRQIYY